MEPLLRAHPRLGAVRAGSLPPQRARLMEAMARVAAERGYAAATVADVVRAANVSRSTFYEQFAGKEELFVEMYRHSIEVLHARIDEAVRGEPTWRDQLRAGIRAYLATLASEPLFARTHLLEVHHAGPAALAVRGKALTAFAERYRAAFAQARDELAGVREPPEEALLVLCAGTEQLAAERTRAGEADRLEELEDVFCDCAESVLAGPTRSTPERS
jgi:AcrR family transcriptional regulator